MAETRFPTQKRSLEKRKKIIEEGFSLICEQGYYQTTTNDIAKKCDVSVGIIYQYFSDKKDIFLEGVKNHASAIMYPMLDILKERNLEKENFSALLEEIIDYYIHAHNMSKKAHEELLAMSHLDNDVAKIFKDAELDLTANMITILEKNQIFLPNSKEKMHIIIGIIDNFCHEMVYHKHSELDYEIMKKEVIEIISHMIL